MYTYKNIYFFVLLSPRQLLPLSVHSLARMHLRKFRFNERRDVSVKQGGICAKATVSREMLILGIRARLLRICIPLMVPIPGRLSPYPSAYAVPPLYVSYVVRSLYMQMVRCLYVVCMERRRRYSRMQKYVLVSVFANVIYVCLRLIKTWWPVSVLWSYIYKELAKEEMVIWTLDNIEDENLLQEIKQTSNQCTRW